MYTPKLVSFVFPRTWKFIFEWKTLEKNEEVKTNFVAVMNYKATEDYLLMCGT